MSVQSLMGRLKRWQFVAAGAVAIGVNPVAAVPAGIQTGDFLIIYGSGHDDFALPSGWTTVKLNDVFAGIGPFYAQSIFTKKATSSESNVTVTSGYAYGGVVMLAYRDVFSLDVVNTFTETGNTSLATNSMNTTEPDDLVVSFYTAGANGKIMTAPANTTTRASHNSSGTSVGILIVDEDQKTPGASTARTVTRDGINGDTIMASLATGFK